MHTRWNLVVLSAAVALGLAGCGSGDATTASIAGESETSPESSKPKAEEPEWDPNHPIVEVQTTEGKIVLKLDNVHAPGTVYNFIEHAKNGHYEQTVFHYVDPESMMIGGGYTVDQNEKPGASRTIRNEAHNGLKNTRGTIAMLRQPELIDSARCQFFINLVDNPALDHQSDSPEEYGYCVFGKVIEGMDVVDRIASAKTTDAGAFVNWPESPVAIESVRQVR